MTKLNKQILDMLTNSDGHLTAEQTFIMAKKSGIDVSMASIYRILTKLASEGYISKIQIPGQPDVFDKTNNQHGHLRCTSCGNIMDIHLDSFDNILGKATGIKDIIGYSLCIDYICDNCKKRR